MSLLRHALTQPPALYGREDSTPDHFSQPRLSMKHMINIYSTDLNTRIPQDQERITTTVFDSSIGEGICLKPTRER